MLWNWQLFIIFLVRGKTHLQIMGVAGSITSGSKAELFMNLGEEWDFPRKQFFFFWLKNVFTRLCDCSVTTVLLFLVLLCGRKREAPLQGGEEEGCCVLSILLTVLCQFNEWQLDPDRQQIWIALRTIMLLHCRARLQTSWETSMANQIGDRKMPGFCLQKDIGNFSNHNQWGLLTRCYKYTQVFIFENLAL